MKAPEEKSAPKVSRQRGRTRGEWILKDSTPTEETLQISYRERVLWN
jgi:hypothetical protein